MRNRHPKIRIVEVGPLPPDNREMLKKLIKKVALRKLKEMQCEAQREAS
jgi:hypothetical protein